RASQPLGFDLKRRLLGLIGEATTLERRRDLAREDVEERALLAVLETARIVRLDPEYADSALRSTQRNVEGTRRWKRVGAASGRLVVREDPFDDSALLVVPREGEAPRHAFRELAIGGLEPHGHLRLEDVVHVLRGHAGEVRRRPGRG